MSDENETVEVMVDDAPVEVEVEVEEKNEEGKEDERSLHLKDLRNQLEDAKRRVAQEAQLRQQAEAFAKQQAEQAYYARAETQDSNLRVIVNAIDAAEQVAANAERALADALAAGDYATVAKVQRAIAQNESQLLQLQQGRADLEERLQSQRVEGRVPDAQLQYQAPPAAQQDPVEAVASRLTPKSAEWLRSHPEMAHKIEKLTAAHAAAVNLEGIEVESPEYFSYIEAKLGVGRKMPSKSNSSSAPVTARSSYSSSKDTGSSMTLSSAEVEQAILNEPDLPREKALEAYARNKQALIREGRL